MGNTYLVSGQATTAEHWLAFPFPWNVVPPRHSDLMPGDVMKITASALPKFGGQPGDYIPWRSAFLPCVHVTPLDLSLKVMLLMGTLESHTTQMRRSRAPLWATKWDIETLSRSSRTRFAASTISWWHGSRPSWQYLFFGRGIMRA